MVLLGLVIVVVRVDAELDLFYGDRLLMLLCLALFLFLLVEVLPVVRNAAHGTLRGGRNLKQIQIFLSGCLERLVMRRDPQLPVYVVNTAKLACPEAIVCADNTLCFV